MPGPTNTPAVPNQANYQSGQNFSIDIKQLYSDFITEIDDNRSIANIQVGTNALNNLQLQTIAGITDKTKKESTVQESRTHAFYRLLGLPIVAKNGQFYNPGLDTVVDPSRQIDKSVKITIANNQDSNFRALSLKRESYYNGILNTFNVSPATILSGALALSSSVHTRAFSIPTNVNVDPFTYVINDQSYFPTQQVRGKVGKNDVSLYEYMDENGNLAGSSIGNIRYHFIEPFIVDARIDFTVAPSTRLVAIPFVPSKKNLLVAENSYVKRPLIEKVIRDRVASTQNTSVSPAQQKIIDYVLNVPTVKNDTLISQMVNNIYNVDGYTSQFENFLFMIEAMCIELVKAQKEMSLAQGLYYWLPLPSTQGPEGGSDVKGLIISQTLTSTLITVADQSLTNLTLIQSSNTFQTNSSEAAGIPDLGGFAFDGGSKFFDLTFNSDTTTSLGDNVTKQVDKLNKTRNYVLGVANTALQTTEIIMGEWSGLGLCDIIAIMASLYTMPIESLLGLLDIDAFNRMVIALNLQQNEPEQNDITDSLQDLINSVNGYYHLMDDIYKNLASNNGLSS
jgi:hypothetical protein